MGRASGSTQRCPPHVRSHVGSSATERRTTGPALDFAGRSYSVGGPANGVRELVAWQRSSRCSRDDGRPGSTLDTSVVMSSVLLRPVTGVARRNISVYGSGGEPENPAMRRSADRALGRSTRGQPVRLSRSSPYLRLPYRYSTPLRARSRLPLTESRAPAATESRRRRRARQRRPLLLPQPPRRPSMLAQRPATGDRVRRRRVRRPEHRGPIVSAASGLITSAGVHRSISISCPGAWSPSSRANWSRARRARS